jgi:hypothetical protein
MTFREFQDSSFTPGWPSLLSVWVTLTLADLLCAASVMKAKVKLSVHSPWRCTGGVEVYLHSFLTSPLDEVNNQSNPGRVTPVERARYPLNDEWMSVERWWNDTDGENWSTGRETLYSVGGRWMNEHAAMVEWHWQGKLAYWERNLSQYHKSRIQCPGVESRSLMWEAIC